MYLGNTIRSAATYNGMTATCVVTVDSRPLVRVEKDGDHFLVHFVEPAEGEALLWESVGCDLDLEENRTSYDIWNCDEKLLKPAERHHKHNCAEHFTYDQLALLYRLDPFGVIKYVENYAVKHYSGDITNQLFYKDNVYKAIFEVKSGKFFFRPNDDGIPVYGSYSNWRRKDVYSLAELIFGKHTIIEFDWVDFLTNSIKAIFSPLEIFSTIFSTIELCQVLFFNGALQGSVSSEISTYLSHELEVTDTDKFLYPEALVEKKIKAFRKFTIWSVFLGVVQAGIDAHSFLDADIANVCKSVKQHINYRVILQNGGLELEVDNICATLDN